MIRRPQSRWRISCGHGASFIGAGKEVDGAECPVPCRRAIADKKCNSATQPSMHVVCTFRN
eukprot:scaffold8307_cov71-Phaeocystis_antarctica.AAC.3